MLIYIPLSSEINSNAINLLTKEGYTILKDKKPNVKQKNGIEVLFIRTYTLANKDYLSQFPNLKFVLRAGVGLDNLDINECKKRNIIVINAPGSNANAVAELVIGLMIMLLRNVLIQREEIYNGKWRKKKIYRY